MNPTKTDMGIINKPIIDQIISKIKIASVHLLGTNPMELLHKILHVITSLNSYIKNCAHLRIFVMQKYNLSISVFYKWMT